MGTEFDALVARYRKYLSRSDLVRLYDPRASLGEAVTLDALAAAPQRGLSATEIARTDDAVSVGTIRNVLRIYAASQITEVAGLAHVAPLGRRCVRYRLTRCGRAYARALRDAYERMHRLAKGAA